MIEFQETSASLLDPTNNMSITPADIPGADPRLRRFIVQHEALGSDYDVAVCLALGTPASQVIDVVAVMPPEPTGDNHTGEYNPFRTETVLRGQNPDDKQLWTIAGVTAASLWAFFGASRADEYRQPGAM